MKRSEPISASRAMVVIAVTPRTDVGGLEHGRAVGDEPDLDEIRADVVARRRERGAFPGLGGDRKRLVDASAHLPVARERLELVGVRARLIVGVERRQADDELAAARSDEARGEPHARIGVGRLVEERGLALGHDCREPIERAPAHAISMTTGA